MLLMQDELLTVISLVDVSLYSQVSEFESIYKSAQLHTLQQGAPVTVTWSSI